MSDELSPSQAAARIGTTTRSLQRWILTGRLPARRVGGRWRVASDALDALVAPAGASPISPAPAAASNAVALRSLFVANRGEIAARIVRTCDRLGIRAVVPDAEGPSALDLLEPGAVVASALAAASDAVHPGYGFLAERPEFAEAVIAAGLRWVGPPPAAIRAMGDKAAARRLAASLGLPVLPGYDGDDQSEAALRRAARRIGLPLLIKPAAGGGGKGMRVVRSLSELASALGASRREAGGAFGDDRVILERFVEGPRHVEVQVLFDAAGGGVHLGERDCSIQRRHQKVLEETPSPAVGEELRARLGAAALRLAGAVGYVSAGTCEFLLADDGSFWFLEMNTRLQVEHPVTEAITGRDLVADQLRIAGGERLESLGLDQAAADAARATGGHAVEVRLYAEDPESGFLPATGRVAALRWPAGPGLRVDAGVSPGAGVGGRFDPLLAKIVAHGADRPEALDRLAAGLDDTLVLGLVTNLRFLRWLVRQPAVREGEARIDTLASIWPPAPLAASATLPMPDQAWAVAARSIGDALLGSAGDDPWAGGWRLNAPPILRLATDAAERAVPVPLGPVGGDAQVVQRDGVAHVDVDGRSVAFRLAPPPDVDRAARAAAAHLTGGRSLVAAPMPGSVVAVHVSIGDAIEAGDPVVTLGAMKMEHVVAAPSSGHVTAVGVRVGDQVSRDQPVATIDA